MTKQDKADLYVLIKMYFLMFVVLSAALGVIGVPVYEGILISAAIFTGGGAFLWWLRPYIKKTEKKE